MTVLAGQCLQPACREAARETEVAMVNRWMSCVLMALALLLPLTAGAQSAKEMRKQVEASMLVTGTVEIGRDGSVVAHAVDAREKLPGYVADFVDAAVPMLRFEPILVDGQPVLAHARMSLRLVAVPAGGDNMTMSIRGAHFGDEYSDADQTRVRRGDLRAPRYPINVAQIGGKGTVYLLLKVARDGSVADAFVEQVNLTALGSAREMESIRSSLAKSALDTARKHWRFLPPTEGDQTDQEYWAVRVPVDFQLHDNREVGYGEWSAYLPGPKQMPDWAEPDPPGFAPDALAAGGIHAGESKYRLVTPLGG